MRLELLEFVAKKRAGEPLPEIGLRVRNEKSLYFNSPEADRACRAIRHTCEQILIKHGTRRGDFLTVVGSYLSAFQDLGLSWCVSDMRRAGISRMDLAKDTYMERVIETGGVSVNVQIAALGDRTISEAERIKLIIPEIAPERGFLMLYNNYGELWVPRVGLRRNPVELLGRANGVDARQFGELVNVLNINRHF